MVFNMNNLVFCAGLVPVLALAQWCGLRRSGHQECPSTRFARTHAAAKLAGLVTGVVADCIDGINLPLHREVNRGFTDFRAPTTHGTFL